MIFEISIKIKDGDFRCLFVNTNTVIYAWFRILAAQQRIDSRVTDHNVDRSSFLTDGFQGWVFFELVNYDSFLLSGEQSFNLQLLFFDAPSFQN